MLLDLPPELIQLILKHCTCTSYLQAAFSCRTLLAIASSSREVILCHLRRTPGVTSSIGGLNAEQLFRLLLKRAAKQLYTARFSATCKLFNFGSQAINIRASSISSSGSYLALVLKGQPTVYRFYAGDGKFSFQGHLEPPACGQQGLLEVLKTDVDEYGGVYVLQRFIEDLEAKHPFVIHALHSRPHGSIYLAYYKQGLCRVRMCSFPDNDGYEPLALAVGNKETFAISWQREPNNELEVVLYTDVAESTVNEAGVVDLLYDSCIIRHEYNVCLDDTASTELRMVPNLHDRGLIERHPVYAQQPLTDLAFNDSCSELHYYYRGQTLYGLSQRIITSDRAAFDRPQNNMCTVRFAESNLPFSVAVPFFGVRHIHEEHNSVTCSRKYLTFGTATCRYPTHGTSQKELWTVACLLKSELRCHIHNCEHTVDLDGGRQLDNWTVAARLWGFQKPSNSLGCIIAASMRGTRLAIANWDILYIWALEPEELIEDNPNGFYGPFSWSTMTEMIELRPILLQLHAVCFKLRFLERENELLALTDRGLMYWDLSSTGNGERTTHQMDGWKAELEAEA